MCWQSVGSLSAVKGVKYAGVLLLGWFPPPPPNWAAESRLCASIGKKGGWGGRRLECMVSLEYFIKYLIEINAISDGYASRELPERDRFFANQTATIGFQFYLIFDCQGCSADDCGRNNACGPYSNLYSKGCWSLSFWCQLKLRRLM